MTDFQNRLYRGDCLEVMQTMNKEGVKPSLIYLDPPFNSNRMYNFVFKHGGEGAEQAAFSDMWGARYSEVTEQVMSDIAAEDGADNRIVRLIKSWRDILSGGADEHRLLNYMLYMIRRLIWVRRILPPNGSVYLHCDPTASHYLKMAMDLIFGRGQFRNEIIWGYKTGGVPTVGGSFARKHDVILFYAKGKGNIFNPLRQKSYVPTLPEPHTNSGKQLGVMRDHIEKYRNVNMRDYWINTGIMPDDDIKELYRNDKERMGYATQKPLSLLERIVKASSNEGDLVFDPFCGCGTTIHAARNLGRRWIGADISVNAVRHIQKRLQERMALTQDRDYQLIECGAQTRLEYQRLSAYDKQKWLVEKVGGVVGPKGGDGGVDGIIRYHAGGDKLEWSDLIVSVKTGSQAAPAMLRELTGTMQKKGAKMGGLILDRDPTSGMLEEAAAAGKIKYKIKILGHNQTISEHPAVQILTSDEIIAGDVFDTPPTLIKMKMGK